MSPSEGQITSIGIKDISQVDQRIQYETTNTKLNSDSVISYRGEKALYQPDISLADPSFPHAGQKMEVIIKDDVEVSKKGELTMDVEDKSIWEVSFVLYFSQQESHSNSAENEESLPGSADHKIGW